MAAECARNALVEKVVDNKGDVGMFIVPFACFIWG
jgi:hypothetical protein